MRAVSHYIFTVLVMTVYGGQVCPYIDTLDVVTWGLFLIVTFGAAFLIRPYLIEWLVAREPYHLHVRRQLILEFSIFFAVALFITLYNMILYEFPFGSGVKVMVGCLSLGLFVAADLALERERIVCATLVTSGRELTLNEEFFPLTKKFAAVATFTVSMIVIIVFLVISRDLLWLGSIDQNNLFGPRLAVIVELAFIGTVVLAEVINLIFSFSKNLNIFISNENRTLVEVANGNLKMRAPVSSNDEFGYMAKYTNQMIDNLEKKTEELQTTRDVTILGLATLAETRDNETGAHILRTQRYVRALAEKLAENPRHKDHLTADTIDLLFKSAPMHDVGKVGVPDAILLKPGKLTDDEFAIMKQHPTYGYEALRKASKNLGENSFLLLSEEIAYTHHEKWDGSGYPNGLKGDEIPLPGRLMALADVYDALISKRVYKEAFSHDKAKSIIVEGKGKHFDPAVVDAFQEVENRFVEIADEFGDKHTRDQD